MAVELKNCRNTVILIQYIGDTPPGGGCLFRGVFETPQTERLSARGKCNEDTGKCKVIFLNMTFLLHFCSFVLYSAMEKKYGE